MRQTFDRRLLFNQQERVYRGDDYRSESRLRRAFGLDFIQSVLSYLKIRS